MDEHEQRARRALMGVRAGSDTDEVRRKLLPVFASALRATHDAAVAAEREKWRALVIAERDARFDVAAWTEGDFDPNDPDFIAAIEHEDSAFQALRAALSSAPMPAPAQAEHDPEVGATFAGLPDRAVHGPADFGAKALGPSAWTGAVCCACDGHAGCVHTCPAQAEQRVSEEGARFMDLLAAHARGAAETTSRIAARLRARADEEWRIGNGATAHASDVLRSEADALEEGKYKKCCACDGHAGCEHVCTEG
jgi:hypothetical protein